MMLLINNQHENTKKGGVYLTDVSMLLSKIEKSGYKKNYIAQKMGITTATLSNKLNGRRDFLVKEIRTLSQILGLTPNEREQIFFKSNVDRISTKR